MTTITFYRQARRDGGIRTGIEIDGNTLLSRFDEGGSDPDPAIVWYVDVKCRGKSLPKDSEGARRFLISHGATIRRAIASLADEIPAGIDPTAWPVRRETKSKPDVRIEVACSAVRRLEALKLSDTLRDVASHWSDLVESLAEVEV
jgi:hypothetical protein